MAQRDVQDPFGPSISDLKRLVLSPTLAPGSPKRRGRCRGKRVKGSLQTFGLSRSHRPFNLK